MDIETRPEYVTSEKVVHLLRLLKPKILQIRIGFEIWKEEIRNRILRKGIPQSEVYRVAKIRADLRKIVSNRVKFFVYVLFGIEGINEEEVKESVVKFLELFDGVIAIRYRRVLPHHPRETTVSDYLLSFLRTHCIDIDTDEDQEWIFDGQIRYVVI